MTELDKHILESRFRELRWCMDFIAGRLTAPVLMPNTTTDEVMDIQDPKNHSYAYGACLARLMTVSEYMGEIYTKFDALKAAVDRLKVEEVV